MEHIGDIIHLNVGGTRFTTSRQTLTWVPDSFFTCLLSGRISSLKDETGAIFIDRDPEAFVPILNFLRTKELDLRGLDAHIIKHEAEYYGISPLVRRLLLCDDLARSQCGDLLFHGYLNVPDDLPSGLVDPTSTNSRRGSVSSMISPSPSSSNFISIRGAVSEPNLKFDGVDQQKVLLITAHHSWIAVVYVHCVCCYWMRDSHGWQHVFTSPYMEESIEKIALNTKMPGAQGDKMVAAATGSKIWLWCCGQGKGNRIGVFDMTVKFDHLFFVGSQFVALSHSGKIGVWHAVTQHWQIQDVFPVKSYDAAGSFLLLGGADGSIYYVDMEKFPLRMKDNDLLVTELFRDPNGDAITALSVYLTPRTCLSGTWIEIAYGTSAGAVRVIVHHPETVSSGPQLFQTFTCHRSAVTKVTLSEKHLVSICSEYNHVRSWSVTRFRGMISTQPGPTPLSSFNVVSIEQGHPRPGRVVGNSIGPYGERDDQQVFVQKVVPDTDQAYLRLASNGKRLCTIKSVDGSRITAFFVHECDGSTRMGSRQRRFLFSGHSNGSVQIWDLTTAMEGVAKHPDQYSLAGPNDEELLKLLEQCDLRASRSRSTTPCASLSPGSSMLSTNNHRFGISNFSLTTYGGGQSVENSLDHRGSDMIPSFNPRIPNYGRQVSIGRTYAPRDNSERTYAPRDNSEHVQQQQQHVNAANANLPRVPTERKEVPKGASATPC